MQPSQFSIPSKASRGFGRGAGKSAQKTGRIASVCAFLALCIAFASAGYLALRDDILGAALSRQALMQQVYEDRITALRAQVDIVTSRQMLDQQAVENRVDQLVARQQSLNERQNFMRDALKRAQKAGAISKPEKKSASEKPLTTGSIINPKAPLRLGSLAGSHSPFSAETPSTSWNVAVQRRPDHSFGQIERSIELSEQAQLAELDSAISKADEKARRLASVLVRQGVKLPVKPKYGIGGPLIVLKTGDKFLDSVAVLDGSLDRLSELRRFAKSIPHGSPTPGQKISSRYGTRKDPFTGQRAVHGGLDFRARTGVPVLATATGVVTKAGRLGGYGKLVELKHANGITTRYAHLSKIHVRVGQKVAKGKTVGKVGSTGRSTGPHLHYEVRKNGKTTNPIKFVRLAKALRPYL